MTRTNTSEHHHGIDGAVPPVMFNRLLDKIETTLRNQKTDDSLPLFDLDNLENRIVMVLRSTDVAKTALRVGGLRYAAAVLRRLGYSGAAHALDHEVHRMKGADPVPVSPFAPEDYQTDLARELSEDRSAVVEFAAPDTTLADQAYDFESDRSFSDDGQFPFNFHAYESDDDTVVMDPPVH